MKNYNSPFNIQGCSEIIVNYGNFYNAMSIILSKVSIRR